MKKHVLIFVFGWFFLQSQASVKAFFDYGIFNIPTSTPFWETYLIIGGNSFNIKKIEGGFQGSVKVEVIIRKGGKEIVKTNYNLLSPLVKDSLYSNGFVDNQRYSLSNGAYSYHIKVTDNYDEKVNGISFDGVFKINYSNTELSCSSMQLLQSFSKSNKQSSISKSGYDLIPHTVNYFPEDQNILSFYCEFYNSDTVLGKEQPLLLKYYVSRYEDSVMMAGLSGFKKQVSAKVNPLLTQFDISNLESGNYVVYVELRNKENRLLAKTGLFFQRKNNIIKPLGYKENRSVYEFFGNYNNIDTLKMFVECLWPISSTVERDWQINVSVQKNPELMKKYIVDYWQKKSGDSLDPLQMWLSYYEQVKIVNKMFKCGKQKGYYTDRGRMYLQYGKPDQRAVQPSEPYTYPYEIWQYYRVYDNTNGQFYNNKKCVFVNKNIADDCYKLIHTDIRGEQYNDKWRFEITKRETNPNVDATKPSTQQGNNYDEFFNNPK